MSRLFSNSLSLRTLRALALLTKFQGVVRGIVFVFADQDFLIGRHMNPAIDHRQAFSGAAGQRDLLGFGVAGSDPAQTRTLCSRFSVSCRSQSMARPGLRSMLARCMSIALRTGVGAR